MYVTLECCEQSSAYFNKTSDHAWHVVYNNLAWFTMLSSLWKSPGTKWKTFVLKNITSTSPQVCLALSVFHPKASKNISSSSMTIKNSHSGLLSWSIHVTHRLLYRKQCNTKINCIPSKCDGFPPYYCPSSKATSITAIIRDLKF